MPYNISFPEFLVTLLVFQLLIGLTVKDDPFSVWVPEEGDLIFQETRSRQARALRIATGSRWTHVGLFLRLKGKPYVFEAVQPVRFTPMKDFLSRSWKGRYAVKRLMFRKLTLIPENIRKLKMAAMRFLGRDYDVHFGWGDGRLYCSEVLWKLFYRVLGIRLGRLRRFRDYNLQHPLVRQFIRERYQNGISFSEKVIGPGDMYASSALRLVFKSW